MFLLKLLMKVLLLPVMLVLFVLRVLVKIGIELSSISSCHPSSLED